jgi:glycosyltransferase involved in cell wall biosynthesis
VARLAPERPGLHLLLIGEGAERSALTARARALGIADRVHLPGLKPDLADWYPLFDVFCMTSHREGLPLVLLEALAAGRPALVTPVGGIPGVIGASPPVAWTFAPGDERDLAQKLAQLLTDADLRRSLGAAGRARVVEHFSRRTMARATAALYDQVRRERASAARNGEGDA